MLQKYIYTLTLFICFTFIANAQETKISIVKGKYTSQKKASKLKTFEVSKGDIIEINLTTLHKRRGLHLWVNQHPGGLTILDFEDLKTSKKTIIAQTDAIFQVFYGGNKLDFEIEIANTTNKPNGPGKGKPIVVQIPDTLYASGYVNKPIGESYSLTPFKEKVILGTTIEPEQICNRNFFTGVDKIELNIPNFIEDEYRVQKLKSYNVTLICGGTSMQSSLMGVVDAGIDTFVGLPGLKSKNKGKIGKASSNKRYKFTKNLDERSDKLEVINETIEITQEGAEDYSGNENSEILEKTAFIVDGGVKKIALESALDATGAPKEAKAIIGKIESFPSVSDMAKNALHKITPTIKGRARLIVEEEKFVKKSFAKIPSTKEFIIQSAMNYGKNSGGCWDIPGDNPSLSDGKNFQVWNLDGGFDRKFKFTDSSMPGYYEIQVSYSPRYRVNVDGGRTKNGTNVELWSNNSNKRQNLKLKHLGNGRFKIYTNTNRVLCLDGRKNHNGSNIHIWEDHNGAWTEWYLVDPYTKKAFVPTKNHTIKVPQNHKLSDDEGGFISRQFKVNSDKKDIKTLLTITKKTAESKAKLLVEAIYEITDFTDVIKYKRVSTPVTTKDFWSAYKINYKYALMFEDQVKDYYKIIGSNSSRPTSEVVDPNNEKQKLRLFKYEQLTTTKAN
ncbi:hypothetical protein SAMN05444411_10773 [Lutibacter oricola]|uniref:Ricin B lectin domain-containing protein n=1 Tax=Lutibacter oricola TaxID=762486 RepID=A0A1H3D7G1_9FLAO|nr:RICIN domain-containing protein [Lutibacter oricola]SDX62325.1 hypothetical protein SAMN05444411_10773 [Lutibacter oricola]